MSDIDPPADQSEDGADWWTALTNPSHITRVAQSLRTRFPKESMADIEDAVTDALVSTWQAAQANRLTIEGDATAYVVAAAKNRLIDQIRRRSRTTATPFASLDLPAREDAISAFIDRDAAASDIRRGLTAALAHDDSTAFRVVTLILDEIERRGDIPTSREVGEGIGLSHTAVSKALTRFRGYLAQGKKHYQQP